MEIKNDEENLLFNDFEDEGSKKSDDKIDFYVKYKDLGLDNDKQYYCYFYEKPDTDKDFVFNKGYVPEIRKNGSGAYDVKYSCNKHCVGLRFFVVDQKIENNKAKDMSPEKNKDVTWYEVRQDEDGKKYIFKLGSTGTEWEKTNISFAYSDNHFSDKKRWKIEPQEKYGDHKFLTHFNNYSQIFINCDKFQQIISNDINDLGVNANNTEFNPNVYACVKLHPGGDFYLDWSGNMKVNLASNSGTGNKHNGYMEDMYILRFYVTNKKLDINEGDKFDENTLFDKNDNISVFEVRRDKSDNMVLWHLKNKEKGEWEVVDGEVMFLLFNEQKILVDSLSYNCKIQSENGIQKSHTVEILDILDDIKKIGENTVKINNTDIVGQTFNLDKTKTDECKVKTDESKTKVKSNYHICKTILFSLLAIVVGFLFGWIYALIPIAALIVLVIFDQIFDFCPGTKKILSYVVPCLSCLKETEEKENNPELDEAEDIKNMGI